MKFLDATCPSCQSPVLSRWGNFRATVRRPVTCRDCSKQFYRRHFVYGAVESVVITWLLIGLFVVFLAFGGLATVAVGTGTIGVLAGIWALEVKTARLKELTDVQRNDAALITQICGILLVIGVLALVGALVYDVHAHQ